MCAGLKTEQGTAQVGWLQATLAWHTFPPCHSHNRCSAPVPCLQHECGHHFGYVRAARSTRSRCNRARSSAILAMCALVLLYYYDLQRNSGAGLRQTPCSTSQLPPSIASVEVASMPWVLPSHASTARSNQLQGQDCLMPKRSSI